MTARRARAAEDSGHEDVRHSPQARAELGDPAFAVNDETVMVAERFRLATILE